MAITYACMVNCIVLQTDAYYKDRSFFLAVKHKWWKPVQLTHWPPCHIHTIQEKMIRWKVIYNSYAQTSVYEIWLIKITFLLHCISFNIFYLSNSVFALQVHSAANVHGGSLGTFLSICLSIMNTLWHGHAIHVTGPLWAESTSHQSIPMTEEQ